ncbi:LuxR C-terminal-related transcriptional regulator [Actinokineospora soli]|uniref:LuxR C-terminal-related transcriptional regulator n=1 Tax=Actinokineospora soli TaxID=1048753 RepID=A0ABW2TTC6_9PSEU
MADACVWLGHLEPAARFLRDGLRLAEENGAPFLVSTGRTTEARLDWLTGRWAGLAVRTRALVEEYRDLTSMTSELELVLGWLAAAEGNWADAGEHFARTGADTPEDAITPVAVAGCAGTAACLMAGRAHTEAVAAVERALAVVRGKDAWTWAADLAPVAVDAYLATDRADDAARVVEELAAGITGRDAPLATAALARCRGTLARERGEAADWFREAAAGYASLNTPYFAALATEQAAACVASSAPAEAVALLSGVVDAFDDLGAVLDAARSRRALRNLGGGKSPRRGRRCYGKNLSPREREVARMLVAGLTNKEVAERLFLSPRTIEQHVARLFRKLGINSRTQLRPHHLD